MPLDFVRYTREIERLDPDLDQLLEQIVGFWERKVRESPAVEGSGRAVRGAHAKTFGVVKAEVQIYRASAKMRRPSIASRKPSP